MVGSGARLIVLAMSWEPFTFRFWEGCLESMNFRRTSSIDLWVSDYELGTKLVPIENLHWELCVSMCKVLCSVILGIRFQCAEGIYGRVQR